MSTIKDAARTPRQGSSGKPSNPGPSAPVRSTPSAPPSDPDPLNDSLRPPSDSDTPYDPFRPRTFRPSLKFLEAGWQQMNRLQEQDVRATVARRDRRARAADRSNVSYWFAGAVIASASVLGVVVGNCDSTDRTAATIQPGTQPSLLLTATDGDSIAAPAVANAANAPSTLANQAARSADPTASSALAKPATRAANATNTPPSRPPATAATERPTPNPTEPASPSGAGSALKFIKSRNPPE